MIDLHTLLLGSREVFRPIYNYNFMAKSGFSFTFLVRRVFLKRSFARRKFEESDFSDGR